jgi:predicted aconitase
MKLTDEEKRILDGQQGEPYKMAMEMLVALGEIYGAEKMIPIKSAHCAGLSLKSHGIAGAEWAEDMAKAGARVCVPTTMNVVGCDRSRDLGLPEDWTKNQMRIEQAYECMGCYGTSSCVPYYHGFVPRLGEHLAWAESSAVVFTNSVLGARDNREGGPSALAGGLVGRTPCYGLHLDENRKGTFLFTVVAELKDFSDYGAMGAYVGRMVGTGIPVFDGIRHPAMEDLVYLGSALASSGSVAMFHMVGVTPEAPTVESALGGNKVENILITDKEIAEGRRLLTSAKDTKVDYVAIGCPHYSLSQIKEVAMLLQGKKVHKDVTMWIHTNVAIKAIAAQLGYQKIIEDAGAILTQDLCTVLSCPEALGFKTLATNSAKMAFYAPGGNQLPTWYGNVRQVVKAAITGKWEL